MSLFNRKPEALRKCAFCGSKPKLCRCGDHKEYVVYQCSRCDETPVRLDEARVSESGARKIWNKRTEEAEHILNIYKRLTAQTTIFTSSES
jgi:hypothetical protein